MTCSGLLGLAIGAANEVSLRAGRPGENRGPSGAAPRDLTQDPAVRAGLTLLGNVIAQDGRGPIPLYGERQGDEYYFLWALERVAVAYALPTIGDRDWYTWGADMLLTRQGRDGGWRGHYGEGGVDTCFALLFLNKANLSRDLTVTLSGQAEDPVGLRPRKGPARSNGSPAPTPAPPAAPAKEAAEKPEPAPLPPVPDKKTTPAPPSVSSENSLEKETEHLRAELVSAPAARQSELFEKYRKTSGVAYTQALATAIPQLSGEVQEKARATLALRLQRMTAETLRARLRDDDPEIRRACARACALKGDSEFVPDLIARLEDGDPWVVLEAKTALHRLTAQDFGPPIRATAAEREAAIANWKAWWAKQKNK
jgi:hypothetical protein